MFRLIVALSVLCLVSGAIEENSVRIVGGKNGQIQDFPYVVSLQRRLSHFCGGSIVSPYYIMTAAHCLKDVIDKAEIGMITARAGSSNRNSGGTVMNCESAVNHPDYNAKTTEYDIGFVKIAKQFVYSSVIKAINVITAPLPGRTNVIASGWGKTSERNTGLPEILQYVQLTSLSTEECRSPLYGYGSAITDSMFCAVGDSKDSCQGDSGGPLVLVDPKGNSRLIGIVSWGAGCAQAGYPGAYCKLSHYSVVRFIKSILKNIL